MHGTGSRAGRRRAAAFAVVTAAAVVAAGVAVMAPSSASPPAASGGRVPAADAAQENESGGTVRPYIRNDRLVSAALGPRTEAQGRAAERAALRRGTTLAAQDDARLEAALAAREASAPARASTAPTFTPVGDTGLATSRSGSISWAPDGSRYAYLGAGKTFVTVRANGSKAMTVKHDLTAPELAWSPSGGRIAVVGLSGTTKTLRIFSSADSYSYKIAYKGGVRLRDVEWLNDGTLVVSGDKPGGKSFALIDIRQEKPTPVWFQATAPGGPWLQSDAVPSPDGAAIAFLQYAAGAGPNPVELWIADADLGNPRKIGSVPGPMGTPVWSAGSSTVYAIDGSSGDRPINAYPAGGGEPIVVAATSPATHALYRRPVSAREALAKRLTGQDNRATAIAASKDLNFAPAADNASCGDGGARSVTLVRSDSWREAAAAGALAAHKCGPVLVTGSGALDSRVAAEIQRILPAGRTVYLVGGTGMLSSTVSRQVSQLGYKVVRFSGADPYSVATSVATKGFSKHKNAFIVSAQGHAEGQVAAAVAALYDVPVLLTDGSRMPKATKNYIRRYNVAAWAVGKPATKAAPWAAKVAGKTPSDTSVLVARGFYWPIQASVLISSSWGLDSLSAGAYVARFGHPVLVTPNAGLAPALRTYLDRNSAQTNLVRIFGRSARPSAKVLTDAIALSGGVWEQWSEPE